MQRWGDRVPQGEQWVRLVVVGQSFLLHQIRKMVGTAVAVLRGVAPPDAIPLALSKDRDVITPMAPELGLFLDECFYSSYNKRWCFPPSSYNQRWCFPPSSCNKRVVKL
jgi:tRNA U38,U39,U40 pseudouridine synthase TruA